MEENDKYQLIAMNIIASSGETRSLAFEALREAKAGNIAQADEMLKQADETIITAHKAQMDLLVGEANGEKADLSILLIHSQDHLMTSMLALDLIKEMVDMIKNK